MARQQLTSEQTDAQLVIGENDDGMYHYEAAGADVRVGPNPRRMDSRSTILRKGDSGPLQSSEGFEMYAELAPGESGPATLKLVPGIRVGRDPRREVERPDDAAVRAGQSTIVNQTGSGLTSGSSSSERTLADNTEQGVYRLQTINLSETSGNWSPDIHLEIQIQDEDGNVTEKMEANAPQLPYNFPSPVLVPENFTAVGIVHNDSANSVGYRLNCAYTKEVLK